MKNRVISLLMVFVLLLGMLPAVSAAKAEDAAAQDITIDFRSTVQEMAEQPWWDELPQLKTASGFDARRIGDTYGAHMSESETAAYDEMRLWMEENAGWTISDTTADHYKGSGGTRLFLCADDASPWAVDHLAYFYNKTDGRSDLSVDFTADEAGAYQLQMDVYFQSTGDTHYPEDDATNPGGCYVDVYLNGELVLDSVCCRAEKYQDYSAALSFGTVELKEGTNNVMLRTKTNVHNGTSYASRANLCLNSISFLVPEPVQMLENSTETIDLLEGYLHHKTVIGKDHRATSSDSAVARAILGGDGTMQITSGKVGEATLTVYEENTALCTVDVIVSEPSAPKAGTQPIVVDFMSFAKQAMHRSWWNDLADTNYAGIKKFGQPYGTKMSDQEYATYQELNDWLKENTNWSFVEGQVKFNASGNGRQFYINNGTDAYGLRFYPGLLGKDDDRSSLILAVTAEEAGLYTMELDLLNEATTSKVKGVDGTTGGGIGDIYVNGQLICKEYRFFADHATIDWLETPSFGQVYLNEGENIIEIDLRMARNLTTNNGRRAINLRAMTFMPVQDEIVEGTIDCDLSSAWNDANNAATINGGVGAKKIFSVNVEESGWYAPQTDVLCNPTGGMVAFFADEEYLGTVNTYGREEFSAARALQYIYLEEGEYDLTAQIVGATAGIAEPRALIESVTFAPTEEPELTVCASGVSGKRGRVLESTILGSWSNGMGTGLQGAEFEVQLSDASLAEVTIVPATETADALLQVKGLKPGVGELALTVLNNGAQAEVVLPVEFTDYVALQTFDAAIPGAVQGQIPRNSLQEIVFDMIGADGDVLYPNEANITYEVSDETIISVDEETNRILALQNGSVTLTITAEQGGVSFTKSFDLVVADAGVNLFDSESSFFDGGTAGIWRGLQGRDVTNAMAWTEIADDGTGNYALRMTLNPDVTKQNAAGAELVFPNGKLVKVRPGQLYEMSFRVRMEDYVKPENAEWDWVLNLQMYDHLTNANGNMHDEYYSSGKIFGNELVNGEDYITVVVPVRAPIGDIDGEVYIKPRLTFGPNTGYHPNDTYVSGWQGTFWLDDFRLREVGFGSVEARLDREMTEPNKPSVMTLVPMTTTGSQIALDKDSYKYVVGDAYSTNEDVVVVGSKVSSTNLGDYYRNWDYPNLKVELIGLNAPAQVITTMTLGELTAQGVLEVSPTDLPNILRDIVYKLDGSASVVLARGETAIGNLEGRTTQLDPIDEQTLRSEGVYFVSSNPKVASVDTVTGDVTAVAEGTATITAYVILEGVTRKINATVGVTDDTDLNEIEIICPVDYAATAGLLQLDAAGMKASGSAADMSLYPVAWEVDSDIASITEDGMLYAYEVGSVAVTASVSVNGKILTASKSIEIIDNRELPGENLFFDFQFGKANAILAGTVEENGIELNRELTYLGGSELSVQAPGLEGIIPNGECIAFDIQIRRSGWYMVEMVGGFAYAAPWGRGLIDGKYIGSIEYGISAGPTQYNNYGGYNTIWLDAGIHTYMVRSDLASKGSHVMGGVRFYAVPDPNPMKIALRAEKLDLVAGENANVTLTLTDANDRYFRPLQVKDVPDFTNYYTLTSSDPSVVSVANMTMTAKAPGTAKIVATCHINGEEIVKELDVTVTGGTVASMELSAQDTTVRPNVEPFAVTLTALDAAGAKVELTEEFAVRYESLHTDIMTVSSDGIVTLTGKLGSAQVKAYLTEGERTIETSMWFTVTNGKTQPSIYTYEERANAQANVLKYDWAWRQKEAAVKVADYYVENLDLIYDMWIRESLPRNNQVGYQNEDGAINYRHCRYCKADLISLTGHYPWIVDPIENPWKITCPICKRDFPSNDFESYYKSGLDEHGYFHADKADPQYLVNELYPEMGEGWGVDNGFGYVTDEIDSRGRNVTHTYIAYYMLAMIDGLGDSKHDMFTILNTIRDAYLYTGDETYGNAGAILTDRLAEIYPEYYIGKYEKISMWALSDGDSGRGKLSGQIWDGAYGKYFANAYDAFFDCFDNNAVIEYLRAKATFKCEEPEDITPDSIRKNIEDNLILEYFKAHKEYNAQGNFAMGQSSLAACAVAIDRLPESQQIIDHLFRTRQEGKENGKYYATGADMMRILIEEICRDGIGGESSFQYNGIWVRDSLLVSEALEGFDLVEYADLWKNQKFVNLHLGMLRLTVLGHVPPQYGEAGYIQTTYSVANRDQTLTAYLATGNHEYAKALYALNGNSVDGIHGDIFHPNPEAVKAEVLNIIREEGQWNMSKSDLLAGHGMAILRKGPEQYIPGVNAEQFSDYNIFFGFTNTSHAQREQLRFDVDAFGLNLSGSMGYPMVVTGSDAMRMQWVRGTISDNNVVVNDQTQMAVEEAGFPLHFEDAGKAKVMDVRAEDAYDAADIYRRTVVTVEGCDGVDYAVDFFRVLGGSEHVYSFHGATRNDPKVEGLDMVEQPFGTYAGADVAFGYDGITPNSDEAISGNGYNWLYNVSRDNAPEKNFTIDWEIEDFHHQLTTSSGIHLKLHVVSEEPMTEVALADGQPPQDGRNPDHVEYALIRRSGEEGMDTLFTAVVEPYQHNSYIEGAELVPAVLVDGTEQAYDRAAAVKVNQKNGRVDYVIYATNPNCTYRIDDLFNFCGFAGVVTYENGVLTYAWGSEATQVADVIENAQAKATGTVLDFTKDLNMDGYTITVELDQPMTEQELAGRYIYVHNDGMENAVYPICSAKISGTTAELYIGDKTLIREYMDELDFSKGYKYNIAVGQTFSIPLSASFDVGDMFVPVADAVVKAGSRLSLSTGIDGAGVTYEAEGLPKGMKLDAKTGTLTWTTSKTQTGRYPITIKAICDGEVMGTMSFVVYVVSYSGSSYTPENCAHSKAVTYTFDNGDGTTAVETVCPACGTITKENLTEEELNKFTLAGSNMTLGNELAVNFLVKATDYKDGQYAVISHNGETTEVELVKYNSAYYAATCKVAAKELADTLSVTIMNAEGKAVSEVYEGSAKSYAMKVLANASTNAKLKTLVVDMLNYGAEAQTFFGYNEENLANSDLTAAQQKLATPAVTCVNRQVKGTNFVGSNLSLEDKIVLNMMFKGTASNGMYAEITYTDYQGNARTVKVEKADFGTYGPYIKIVVDEIVLADAYQVVTVTLYNADHSVYGQGSDSVESYAKRTGDTLAAAMMKFATSAKAYLG